jgi:hypothetical protein
MSGRLFTDKLVCGWLEVLGVRSLDSATRAPAYPAHAVARPVVIWHADTEKPSTELEV